MTNKKNIRFNSYLLGVLLMFSILYFGFFKDANIEVLNCAQSNVDLKPSGTSVRRDVRIIVLTYNRPESLAKLLTSLNHLDLLGDKGYLDIWIDRSKDGSVHNETVKTATEFKWTCGVSKVHVHPQHVGIYGQWINTWHPVVNSSEIAILLEDDLTLSPYAYTWLRAAHDKYDHLPYISGYTLQSEGINKANGGGPLTIDESQSAFGYKLLGSWGFSPNVNQWIRFQKWFNSTKQQKTKFHPYVKDAPMITGWYKGFERSHKEDTMWTIWFIYFSDKYNLYCVYNNLRRFTGEQNTFLAANRKERGLHFSRKQKDNVDKLLNFSPSKYELPTDLLLHGFDGKVVNNKS